MKVTRWIMFARLGLAVATAGAAQLGRNTAPVTVRNTGAGLDIGPATGLQLALVAPVQIFAESFAVSGLRVNLIFGRNRALRGLDLGTVNEITERVEGVQLALASNLAGDLAGLQIGLFNSAATSEAGCCQLGAINILRGEDSQGTMLGMFNQADGLRGFQFGLINICNTLDGCQLGLINIITQSEALMFCPIFNAQF
jgi:hypothetical protein